MRIWYTADTHHGIRDEYAHLTEALARACIAEAAPGDVLVLGGDNACADGHHLAECLAAFSAFPGPRAVVPGNHDLWTGPGSERDSHRLYEEVLPAIAEEHGFHALDRGPLKVDAGGGARLGIAGCAGGFDFTLADLGPLDEAERAEVLKGWQSGQFRHVFWNDYRYLVAPSGGVWDHRGFAAECAARLADHLDALERDPAVSEVFCASHFAGHLEQVRDHPAGRGRPHAGNLWFRGLGGSVRLGEAVRAHPKARTHACGHSHHERVHRDDDGRLWVNVGCDYHRKRWLVYEPGGAYRFTPWVE